jgi:hypothetical protein
MVRHVCWSATADLRAGMTLAGLGMVSIGLVTQWRQALLSLCPLLLGAHQLVEYRVWQSLRPSGMATGATVQNNWTLAWAFIAVPVLVICSPVATLIAFPHRWRRLVPTVALGFTMAGVCSYGFFTHGVTAVQDHHVLDYKVHVPFFAGQLIMYQFVSWVPFLLSGDRYVIQTGIGIGAAGAVAAIVDFAAYESIWCAFGAVAIFMNVRWLRHDRKTPSAAAVPDFIDLRDPVPELVSSAV